MQQSYVFRQYAYMHCTIIIKLFKIDKILVYVQLTVILCVKKRPDCSIVNNNMNSVALFSIFATNYIYPWPYVLNYEDALLSVWMKMISMVIIKSIHRIPKLPANTTLIGLYRLCCPWLFRPFRNTFTFPNYQGKSRIV